MIFAVGYKYGYQGQEYDAETGLNNFDLRQYDARIGRWFAPDPYGQYHSPYLAMGNNPVSQIDPDGGYSSEAEAESFDRRQGIGGNGGVADYMDLGFNSTYDAWRFSRYADWTTAGDMRQAATDTKELYNEEMSAYLQYRSQHWNSEKEEWGYWSSQTSSDTKHTTMQWRKDNKYVKQVPYAANKSYIMAGISTEDKTKNLFVHILSDGEYDFDITSFVKENPTWDIVVARSMMDAYSILDNAGVKKSTYDNLVLGVHSNGPPEGIIGISGGANFSPSLITGTPGLNDATNALLNISNLTKENATIVNTGCLVAKFPSLAKRLANLLIGDTHRKVLENQTYSLKNSGEGRTSFKTSWGLIHQKNKNSGLGFLQYFKSEGVGTVISGKLNFNLFMTTSGINWVPLNEFK